jgi:hypothetical protein
MRKLIYIILIIFISTSSFSCATLTDKFVRKNKKDKKEKQIFQTTNQVYPTDVRYNNHWIYYEIWAYEVIDSMGENQKKTYNSAQRALYNLKEMQVLLKEPKAGDLNPYIEQMARFTKELKSSSVSHPTQKKIARELRAQIRDVKKQFNSDLMDAENWIKPDVN